MGGSSQDILIQIGADISDLSRSMKQAQDEIRGFGKQTESSTGKGALSIGKLVTAMGGVALAAKGFSVLKDSIGSAFDRIDVMERFERVMTTLTGSTDKANAALDATREAVTGTAYGLDTAAKGVQDFVTRGMDVQKATDTMAAWGDAVAFYGNGSNEQLANVSDALAKMTSKGKVDMDQMNRLFDAGIDGVGMFAQATGRDAESVQKDLSSGAISAETFIDTVTTAMMEGTNGVQNIAGAAKEAGASWGASFDNMKAAVTRGTIDIIQSIDEMLSSNGLPDMRQMVADFGSKFEEVLKKAAAAIPPLIDKAKQIYDVLQPWMPLIKMLAVGIGTFVLAFATMNTAVKAINAVKLAFAGLKAVMMATSGPWLLLIAAVAMLAYMIYKHWDEIKEYTAKAWAAISAAVVDAWNYIVDLAKSIWGGISDFFTGLWDGIVNGAVSAWTGFVDTMTSIWTGITDFFSGIWSGITDGATSSWTGITETLSGIWNGIVERASAIWNTLKETIMTILAPMIESVTAQFAAIKEGVTTIFEGLKTYFTGAWDLIKNIFLGAILLIVNLFTGNFTELVTNAKAIFANIMIAVTQMWDGIKTIFGGAIEMVKTIAINGFNALSSAIGTALNFIVTTVQAIWERIKSLFNAGVEFVKSAAINGFNAIVNGIKSAMSAALNAVTSAWNSMKAAVKAGMAAIVSGVVSGMARVLSAVISAWNSVKSFFTTTIPSLVSTVRNGFSNMVSAIVGKMVEVVSSIKTGWNNAKSFLTNIDLKSIGANIIKGLVNGIKSKISDVKNAVKDAADAITGKISKILGIKSPSRVLMKIGKHTGQGLVNGIVGMKSRIEKASSMMAQWATPEIDSPDVPQPAGFNVPMRGVGTGAIKAEQSIQHTIEDRYATEKKPAHITLELGGRDFETFVEDIDGTIRRKERLKRTTTKGRS